MSPIGSRTVRACLLLCLPAAFTPLAAQSGRAKTRPAITVSDLRSRLFLIAGDSMMGRETGSKGDFQTADYVAAEFKRLGLTPAGENGGWFQAVPFWVATGGIKTIFGNLVGRTTDGSHPGTLVAGSDFIVIPRLVNATLAGPVPTILGGALDDPAHWIDSAAAVGKVVVISGSDSAVGPRLPAMLNRAFLSPRFAGARAVAVAQLDRIPHGMAVDMGRARVTHDSSRIARPLPLLVSDRAKGVLLTGEVRAGDGDSGVSVAPTPYPARNVIGTLPGRDPKLRGEYVSVTGHNDHVGICMSAVDHDSMRAFLRVLRPMGADTRTWNETPAADARIRVILDSLRRLHPPRADSICNGADDDGTGTVAILELAEAFASMPMAQRPRRSLLFVSHVGEERGLVGSAWYTDHATVPVDSIVAEIDEDMIGRGAASDLPKGGPGYLEVVGARRLSHEFGDLLEAANAAQPVPFVFNYEFDAPGHPLQYYCRADHYSYARYGIPSVAFSRGEHLDYHQVTDEAQYIDYPDMLRVVNMVHDAVLRIANLDHRPKVDSPKTDPHARCVQ
jgi:hypothetical protein